MQIERRDPGEVLTAELPIPLRFKSQRDFVRKVLEKEVGYRAIGTEFNASGEESDATLAYRSQINAEGSPSQTVAAGYRWTPGTELTRKPAHA